MKSANEKTITKIAILSSSNTGFQQDSALKNNYKTKPAISDETLTAEISSVQVTYINDETEYYTFIQLNANDQSTIILNPPTGDPKPIITDASKKDIVK